VEKTDPAERAENRDPADRAEKTDPAERAEKRDPVASKEQSDPAEATEKAEARHPIEPIEATEAKEPIERIEWREPIDRTEFFDPMERNEPSERIDSREAAMRLSYHLPWAEAAPGVLRPGGRNDCLGLVPGPLRARGALVPRREPDGARTRRRKRVSAPSSGGALRRASQEAHEAPVPDGEALKRADSAEEPREGRRRRAKR
jgi:hypothetical protein